MGRKGRKYGPEILSDEQLVEEARLRATQRKELFKKDQNIYNELKRRKGNLLYKAYGPKKKIAGKKKLSTSKEIEEYEKKRKEFKRWLELYFIENGNWKLTDKAIAESGLDDIPRQTMEFAEVYSDREREERIEYRVGLTAKEKKRIAYMKISSMIDEGKAEELYNGGYIVKGKSNWRDKVIRTTAIKKLIEILDKDPRDITKEKIEKNGLRGLIAFHKNSPYAAISEAFPELDIKPWEMAMTSMGFYEYKNNRVAAVKWLVEKLKKDPRDLTQKDFQNNRLGGLEAHGSVYSAVKEAFPEMDIKPWEMVKTPRGSFEDKENRIAAMKSLAEKLEKDPRGITAKDLENNGLSALLQISERSPYQAIKEAFPDIELWEMKITPKGFFEKKENRVATVKWLVEKTRKDPRDLRAEDFKKNSLSGLLSNYYDGSPYKALKEAGLATEADEKQMRNRGCFGYRDVPSSKEAREAARKLARNAEKTGPKNNSAKNPIRS